MLRSSRSMALLLVSVLAASALSLAGCSAPTDEGQPDDATALGDDELNAVNNKMGLKLEYDAPTGRVRATLKARLPAGERLMLRVRRGRIAVDGLSSLDCSELAVAAPLAPTAPVTSRTVYVGPEIDPTLLVNVYKQEWIEQNLSGPTLARLSREGGEAIVDACIVADRAILARLQTSLAYAWDAGDPNASAQIAKLR